MDKKAKKRKIKMPAYMVIHDDIKEKIENKFWDVGEKIPTERELALEYNVARMTLRQAIKALADEGILQKRLGSGTFVSSRKVQEKMQGVTSFTEVMEQLGKKPSTRVVSFHVREPSKDDKEQLELEEGKNILVMERIRYADDEPICFEIASIPLTFVKDFHKEELTKSFYKTLHSRFEFGKAKQVVSAATATPKVAEFLDMRSGEALLFVTQLSYLSDGRPFEYVKSYYNGKRFEFVLER